MRNQQPREYVGVAISEGHFDVHLLPEGLTSRFTNDPGGIGRLLAWLGTRSAALVVVEATGGIERRLVSGLQAAGLAVAVVNPRQIRDFTRAGGLLAKTDWLHARVLAMFAERMRPWPTLARCAVEHKLTGLVLRRRQLTGIVQVERDQCRRCADTELRQSLEQHLAWLEDEVVQIERLIEQAITAVPDGKPRADLLPAVPGVGRVTAAKLLALLPELGRLDGKDRQPSSACSGRSIRAVAEANGLRGVGTAPFARDGGLMRGKRTVGGGRQQVRTALYMATLVATRLNRNIKVFYQRLIKAGKPKKLALTAAMRKLDAILRTRILWRAPETAA